MTSLYHDILSALAFQKLDPTKKEVLANLGRFNQLLADYEKVWRLGGRRLRKKVFEEFEFFLKYAERRYEENLDISTPNAVQISTLHQAKGLEWPLVFFFAVKDTHHQKLNPSAIPEALYDAGIYIDTTSAERKLFYVALTRARDALILTTDEPGSLLSDLPSIPEELHFPELPSPPQEKTFQTLGVSELIMCLRCPYKSLFFHVWGYQPGIERAMDFGRSLHHCLRKLAQENQAIPLHPKVAQIVKREFFMRFVSPDKLQQYKKIAKKRILEYLKKRPKELHSNLSFPPSFFSKTRLPSYRAEWI